MKIQNYGDWKGDKPGGHHPPACTCYRCNEERRRLEASKEEERRVKEYDRRVGENQTRSAAGKQQSSPNRSPSQSRGSPRNQPRGSRSNQSSRNRASQSDQPSRTNSQQRAAEAVQQSKVGARPVARAWPTPSSRRPGRQRSKVVALLRVVTASALRYVLALHAAAVVGLVVYALTQGGAPNVMPTLHGAAEAYVNAWR
jgi:DNA mismatch repair ATPase MutL